MIYLNTGPTLFKGKNLRLACPYMKKNVIYSKLQVMGLSITVRGGVEVLESKEHENEFFFFFI